LNSYSKQIQQRIKEAKEGSIFVNSDFTDIANKETIRKNLNRLAQKGTINRILKGVYEKPKFSTIMEEYVAADPVEVANAIARSYNWTIIPCGNSALNILGVSTQVPSSWCFYSDGPYKTYTWDNIKIEFKRRSKRDITDLSYITALVIHALKTLGKENTTSETIKTISSKLSSQHKETLLNEGRNSASWIFEAIRQISK